MRVTRCCGGVSSRSARLPPAQRLRDDRAHCPPVACRANIRPDLGVLAYADPYEAERAIGVQAGDRGLGHGEEGRPPAIVLVVIEVVKIVVPFLVEVVPLAPLQHVAQNGEHCTEPCSKRVAGCVVLGGGRCGSSAGRWTSAVRPSGSSIANTSTPELTGCSRTSTRVQTGPDVARSRSRRRRQDGTKPTSAAKTGAPPIGIARSLQPSGSASSVPYGRCSPSGSTKTGWTEPTG